MNRGLGWLLIAVGLLAFAPLVVLGPAIGWPASLGKPPAEQLAAIAAAPDAVRLGYGLYLAYSVLIAPLLILLAARVFGGLAHPWAAMVAAFGALSTLARAIGILRWLTVMPALATTYMASAGDEAVRHGVVLVFSALNEYGGGIGEILGVSLFMAVPMALLGLGAWQDRTLPRWLGGWAVACAVLLASLSLPTFGIPVEVPIAVAVTSLSAWMLACGAWILLRGYPSAHLTPPVSR